MLKKLFQTVILCQIFFLELGAQCHYKLYMYDSYGDGWNGAYLEVTMNGSFVGNYECQGSFTLDSVYSTTGATMDFIFHSGSWDSEITFTIVDPLNDTLFSGAAPSDLDNLLHTSTSSCASPTGNCSGVGNVLSTNVTTNSADISWTPGLNDSIWNLRYGISGFALSGVGTQLTNLQNTLVTLNTLLSSTSYDVYVQSVCDSGYVSSWNGPHSFTTGITTGTCGAFMIELYDSYGDGWNGGLIDIIVNGNNLQTITLQQGAGPEQFFVSIDSSDVIDLMYTPGSWPEENSYVVYDHTNVVIATQSGSGTSGPPNTMGLTACPLCVNPVNLSVSNITPTDALIAWNSASGSMNGIWDIEWGLSGFAIGSGATISNVTTTSYLLTGLSSFTSYDFYVQENCGLNGSSYWSGPFSFATLPVPGTCGMYTLSLSDSWGDGWNGGYLDINVNNIVIQSVTLMNGNGPEFFDFPVDSGDVVSLFYNAGGWPEENSYELFDENNNIIASQSGSNGTGPLSTTGLIGCNSLLSQGNCGLLKVELYDDFCDGWPLYGASMDVIINGVNTQTILLPNGCGPETFLFPVDSGGIVDLVYSTIYQNEHSYKVYDQFGTLIHEKTSSANNSNGPESTYGIQLCDAPNLIMEKEKDIIIYPNPAKTVLNLESSTPISSTVLRNVLGQVVLEVNENDIQVLDLSTIPNGNYVLTLSNSTRFSTHKVNVVR